MEYLAVPGGSHNETLRVTVAGAVLVCLVLLVLYHVLVAKKQFAASAAGLTTSSYMTLQHARQDQLHVADGGKANFQGGPEPPLFWGSSGGQELSNDQHMNIGTEGADMQDSPAAANFRGRNGKAGFTDAQLALSQKGL